MNHEYQEYLRKSVMKSEDTVELLSELPLENSINDVFDEGLSKGSTNVQLFGSNKPNRKKYELTQIVTLKHDPTDNEIGITPENHTGDIDFETNRVNQKSFRIGKVHFTYDRTNQKKEKTALIESIREKEQEKKEDKDKKKKKKTKHEILKEKISKMDKDKLIETINENLYKQDKKYLEELAYEFEVEKL